MAAKTRRRGGPPPMREEVEGLRAIAGLPASPSAARRRHTAAQAAWQRHGGGRRVSRWELAPQGQWPPTGRPARSLQPAFDLVFCLRARHTVYHPWLTGGGGGRPGTEATSRTPSAPPLSPRHKPRFRSDCSERFRHGPYRKVRPLSATGLMRRFAPPSNCFVTQEIHF